MPDGQVMDYRYDPIGRRISKQDSFGTPNTGDQLAQEQRNNLKKTYVYEPDSFKPLALLQDEKIYHYHLDHLGTPRELTNQQGSVVRKVKYKTYGNVALKEVEEVENNLRFQGQYFDEETGLHYNRHRYYDPSVGQFTTQDPIGLLGGVNNYQYAPNPTGWVDPLGLNSKPGDCGTVTVSYHEGGHFSVSVASAAMEQITHQVHSSDYSSTRIVDGKIFPPSNPVMRSVTIKIPNVEKAMRRQRILMNRTNLGPYDRIDNSCVSHVCEILEAGGLDVPEIQGSAQSKYLLKLTKGG